MKRILIGLLCIAMSVTVLGCSKGSDKLKENKYVEDMNITKASKEAAEIKLDDMPTSDQDILHNVIRGVYGYISSHSSELTSEDGRKDLTNALTCYFYNKLKEKDYDYLDKKEMRVTNEKVETREAYMTLDVKALVNEYNLKDINSEDIGTLYIYTEEAK